MSSPILPDLNAAFDSTLAMRAVFSDRARIQRMLDVEAALARAEAQSGIIPAVALAAINAVCDADQMDFSALASAASMAGNLAIPLVKQLTARVASIDAEAAKYVHWGATSQDIIDTGLVLQLRDACTHIEAELLQLGDTLALMAEQYRDTPQVGRTWMQQALPITFGLKVAGWLDALQRHRTRIAAAKAQVLVLQFGGATGTLASLGKQGLQVASVLAAELKLTLPDMPWHVQRDRFGELATTLGLLVGSLGKMARDISLLSQTEIAELAEPVAPGRGGSSTLPHKRNPVACAVTLAAAVRVPGLVGTMLTAMVQENERALGGWQAEWECLPQIVQLAATALQHMLQAVTGLQVDTDKMRANLDLTDGQIMAEAVTLALAEKLGRLAAHELVERACHRAIASRQHLRTVLAQDPDVNSILNANDLDSLFNPAGYTGQAAQFVERVVQTWRKETQR
ncbi:MAG TPA: 3-carboxy-cis,cis-muconate cycloisomerase [Burkholderiaceae bacterium]|nr:3-carboxy-cis,cis-muconate cycloisomerase [Burkholderiaceae bacterium]